MFSDKTFSIYLICSFDYPITSTPAEFFGTVLPLSRNSFLILSAFFSSLLSSSWIFFINSSALAFFFFWASSFNLDLVILTLSPYPFLDMTVTSTLNGSSNGRVSPRFKNELWNLNLFSTPSSSVLASSRRVSASSDPRRTNKPSISTSSYPSLRFDSWPSATLIGLRYSMKSLSYFLLATEVSGIFTIKH